MKLIMWLAALVAIGALALCAQLDRASRTTPALAARVPAPFGGFALEPLAAAAMTQNQPDKALEISRDLLRVRPLPAENLRLFAQASILDGDPAAGSRALTLAGQRGWRDPFTQLIMAAAAMDSGDLQIAGQRLVALYATDHRSEQADALMARLLQSADGREVVAALMLPDAKWVDDVLGLNLKVVGPAGLGDLLARAERHGANISCDTLKNAARRLRRSGAEDAASVAIPGRCTAV